MQKGPLFPIFKGSSSIHKNNPALVASIVLKKIYFHGICALSKKICLNYTRSCAFAQKAKFYALKMLKEQNLTHPKAAKLATLDVWNVIAQLKKSSAGWDHFSAIVAKQCIHTIDSCH